MSRESYDKFWRTEVYANAKTALLDATTPSAELQEIISALEKQLEHETNPNRVSLHLLLAICLEVLSPEDAALLRHAQHLRDAVRGEADYVTLALTFDKLRTRVLYERFVGAGQQEYRTIFYGPPAITGAEVIQRPQPPGWPPSA